MAAQRVGRRARAEERGGRVEDEARAPVCLTIASTRWIRPNRSYSPETSVGPSIGRVMSAKCSVPWRTDRDVSRPRESPLSCRSLGDSSTATMIVGTPWRARFEAICRPTTVLPVPLLPAIRVERPSGMPPCVRMSRPGTPVCSFFSALMPWHQLHRHAADRTARPSHAGSRAPTFAVRKMFHQRRREGDAVFFAGERLAHEITDRDSICAGSNSPAAVRGCAAPGSRPATTN